MINEMGPNLRRALDELRAGTWQVDTVGALRRILADIPEGVAVGPFAPVEYSPSDNRVDLHPVAEPDDDEGDEIVMAGERDVRIYGAGDDLIEVEGGRLTEEWNDVDFGSDGGYVLVSTGDVLHLRLTDAGWRVDVVVNATDPVVSLRPDAPEGERDELVTIAGPVRWITATRSMVVRA